MNRNSREARLVARVNEDVHQLVRAAAELSGSSITQFLVDAAVSKALEVTEQATRIKLTMDGAEQMLEALNQPASPPARLLKAAERYKEHGINDTDFTGDPQSP